MRKVSTRAARKGVWTTVQVVLDPPRAILLVDAKQVAEQEDMPLRPEDLRATQCYLGRGLNGGHFKGAIGRFTVQRGEGLYTVKLSGPNGRSAAPFRMDN